jgi:TolB-like protein
LFILLLLFGAGFSCFAQDTLSFNDALKDILSYLIARMPAKSTVAVLNFQSDYPNLSEYIIDDITSGLVNTDRFTVVDRRSLELLEKEMAFQLSGEVSDETALAIGKKLGAQTVISGAITYLGEFYRMRVQAIEVQSARIQGSRTITVGSGRLLATLTGNPWTGSDTPDAAAAPEAAPEPEYVEPAVADTGKTAPTPAPAARAAKTASPLFSDTKLFYMGLRGGFSTRFYHPVGMFHGGDSPHISFSGDFTAQMSFQIFKFLALQAEAIFNIEDSLEIEILDIPISLSYSAMMLPLLAKITFRPGRFLFAGFGGIYFTIPFTAMSVDINGQKYSYNYTAPMGVIAGGNIGIKLGPGTLFLDVRYAGDVQSTTVQGDWGSHSVFSSRDMALCSLGYEFGIGGGKGK